MAKRKREPLSAARIEVAALDLIEEGGLDAFSTRKLAIALGCEAMSIYHYFPSKAHLMDALVDRVVGEMTFLPADRPWRERLRALGFAYRTTALRHPAFVQFLALHRLNTRTGLGFLERVLTIFRDAGFDTEQSARLFRVMSYYIIGAALDEAAGYGKGTSAVEPVDPDEVTADFPMVAAVNPYFKAAHHEATFAIGIDILLDGLEAEREAARGAAGSGARFLRSGALPSQS